jgi:hypothetical protein
VRKPVVVATCSRVETANGWRRYRMGTGRRPHAPAGIGDRTRERYVRRTPLANTRLTIVITLIRMFIEGPEVSLNGSPTVSPTTAALCGSLPLPP